MSPNHKIPQNDLYVYDQKTDQLWLIHIWNENCKTVSYNEILWWSKLSNPNSKYHIFHSFQEHISWALVHCYIICLLIIWVVSRILAVDAKWNLMWSYYGHVLSPMMIIQHPTNNNRELGSTHMGTSVDQTFMNIEFFIWINISYYEKYKEYTKSSNKRPWATRLKLEAKWGDGR